MAETASLCLVWSFVAVVTLVVVAWLWLVFRYDRASLGVVTAGTAAWLLLNAALALSGVLQRFEARPPPLLLVLLAMLALGVWLGRSALLQRLTRNAPLPLLVFGMAFRLPLELVMHEAAREGVMPVEMSFSGYNFDVVTGVSAIVVAVALARGAPRWLAQVWNVIGAGLLVVILAIAVACLPALHVFGQDPAHLNTWVAQFPFVYLPSVCVLAALTMHVALFARVRTRPS